MVVAVVSSVGLLDDRVVAHELPQEHGHRQVDMLFSFHVTILLQQSKSKEGLPCQ